MTEQIIAVLPDAGLERAFAFFMLNRFVVLFTVGTVTAVAVLIGLLYIFRRWGEPS